MTYDFDIEEAFNIWGQEKHYYDKCRNDQNVLDYYKKNGEHVLLTIKKVVEDFYKSEAYKTCNTVSEMFEKATEDFLKLYPDFPSENVIKLLGNNYCYDWK